MYLTALVFSVLLFGFVESESLATESPSSFKCATGQFKCKAEKCIPENWKCDGDDDCGDGSDELNCSKPTCHPEGEFSCSNSKCIPKKWVCDGDNDCGDRSDEIACNSTIPPTCATNYFQCNDSRCLPMRWKCDGQADCKDGSDESNCGTAKCSADEYQCRNGNCISSRWKCDGDNDCGDNSDEDKSANCGPQKCSSTDFECSNGQCVPLKWKCDGDADCTDKSDEVSCNVTTKAPVTCPSEFWRCSSSQCILNGWKCDGDKDCLDGSDEENCDRVTCPSTKLSCASGRECYLKAEKCNGVENCKDGSDEVGCSTGKAICTSNHFNCSDGKKCISQSRVCDNIKDCPMGEDEPTNCFINECIDHNGHCMHNCHDLKIGFKCSCKPGYVLSSDRHTCNDLNECSLYGMCHQLCTNEKGSYKCSCANGYLLEINRRSCKATGSVQPRLIFANRYDIRSFGINGSDYRLVAGGLKGIVGLDFDYSTNYVYWTDVHHEILQRARIDRYNSTELLLRDLHTPDGLSVDWIGRKLYWTDTGLKKIEVSELDGTNNMDLVSVSEHGQPRAIACDPNEGYLYWTDWGKEPGIERISMDGDATTRQQLITKDIIWPNGLSLDFAQNKMYWIDSKLKRLEVANMDGSGRVLLASTNIESPFALTNFEDNLYWTDWKSNGIKITNKFNMSQNVRQFSANHIAPMGIKVFHPLRQPSGVNPCGSNNGGCSHLCLIAKKSKEGGFSCKCPRGMYIQSDGKRCDGVPATRKPRPTQYPFTPKARTTAGMTQSTARKLTTASAASPTKQDTAKRTEAPVVTDVPHVVNPEKATKTQDSTSASVGLVIGITLSLLVICLGIGAGIWYYRTRQQGLHSIMYYKDMSTAPLEEDFDGDNDDDKSKTSIEYQGV